MALRSTFQTLEDHPIGRSRTIVVTGASGQLGRPVIAELREIDCSQAKLGTFAWDLAKEQGSGHRCRRCFGGVMRINLIQ